MTSPRLIRVIEENADALTRGLIHQLKSHARTVSYARFSDAELYSRIFSVHRNLGAWLDGKPRAEIQRNYEALGKLRYAEGVPLHELIYALVLTKKNVLLYIKNYGRAGPPQDAHSEEELRKRVEEFFEDAIYYAAAGYESAMLSRKLPLAAGIARAAS